MTLDLNKLVKYHRGRGLLLDANLLVPWAVGSVNRSRITSFKRTQNFTLQDYDLLRAMLNHLGEPVISTPHRLSQLSDLTDMPGPERRRVRDFMRTATQLIQERFTAAKDLTSHPLFARLGLADAAVATVSAENTLVITADVELYLALATAGLPAINFNHLRARAWSR